MFQEQKSALRGLALFAAAATAAAAGACMKKADNASTQSINHRPPTKPAPGKQTLTLTPACQDAKNTLTTVDTWTVKYNPAWAANVLITLQDKNNPNSLVFTHPVKELGDNQIIEDASCLDASRKDTNIGHSYPIVGGVNLFSKIAPACPGGKPIDGEYRYLFVNRDKKYIAVSKGPDGCSNANLSTPGNCYLWGVVEGSRVYMHNNACLAGFDIHDRVGGIAAKKVCETNETVNIVGRSYPAGFLLIPGPFPGWSKAAGDCGAPTPTTPPKDPTPVKTAVATPTQPSDPTPTPANNGPIWYKK